MVILKRTLLYITMVASILFMLTSCTGDIFEPNDDSKDLADGVPVTLTFQAAFPGRGIITRSVSSITNLTLLVFNEKHRYLYRAKATLQEIVQAPGGITFLPDGVKHPAVENKVYKFTVTLMSSSKPRIIHFVADYDKIDDALAGDQELEGADEGEVMPRIISKKTNDFTYWQVFRFDRIDQNCFNNKAFELLRDKAKITVHQSQNSGFELKGFSIHNAPDRGTIVSYASKTVLNPSDPRNFYRDVLYTFPVDPTETTLPADIQLLDLGNKQSNLNPIPVFEYSNRQAESEKQLSVILYGKRNSDTDYSYYKVDLVQNIYADEAKTTFIGTQRFDLIRNYNYIINIVSAKGKGYSTYEEAVRNPAGNNLFASVELQNYADVSDGEHTLIVENTNAIMTLPGNFSSAITFVTKNVGNPSQHVNVFLNQKACNGAITGDPYIDYAKYDSNTGMLNVNVKDIPTNEDLHYVFNVVATPPNNIQVHLQRTITLTLRKRYDFHLKIEDKDPTNKAQGSEVDMKFTIPGTLPSTLYPFNVYIAADQLSPLVNSTYNDHLKVLKKGKRIYYVYTVRTASTTNQEITLHFQRTRTNGSCDVTVISDNFNSTDAILPNHNSISTDTRGKLTYSGISYVVPKVVPSSYRTKLQVSGVSGVTAKMASAGYVEFTGLESAPETANLTLTADIDLGNGTVKAIKTLTVNEWKKLLADKTSMELDISEITVEDEIKYKASAGLSYEALPTGSSITVTTSDTSISPVITSTGNGTYKMTVSGLTAIKRPIAFTFKSTISGVIYESYSVYLSSLLDNPIINLTTR